jgi:hypothetical protein
MQEFRVVKGIPIEVERSVCDPDATDAYFQTPGQFLGDSPAYLVINLDETRHQECVDGHAESVFDPSSYKGKTICVPVRRSSQHSMLSGAITADGGFLKLLVIIGPETCETEFFQFGYPPGSGACASQENGLLQAIFLNRERRTSLPCMSRRCAVAYGATAKRLSC